MNGLSDIELLDAYATRRSEEAFRELVARHVNFVYSAAMRQLRNPDLAQEATQAAFIALANKAGRLGGQTVVAGWLHRAAHFAALNLQRSEARRKHWEEEAATMNSPSETGGGFPDQALPHIDGALAELNENDRAAVILRFLQQRSFQEVAQILGTSEDAAKKRVSRALERLRDLLTRRGVTVSAAALAAGLSQMPATAAPSGFASTLAAAVARTTVPSLSLGADLLKSISGPNAKVVVVSSLIILVMATLFWRAFFGQETTASANGIGPWTPRIKLASVMVDNQDQALKFYTGVLGFVTKFDVPTGEPGGARWLTVVSVDETNGAELLLEPIGFAPARTYQKALFENGIPLVTFMVTDIRNHIERLKGLGVKFRSEPAETGQANATEAIFEDTCGNNLRILQVPATASAPPGSALRIRRNSVLVNDQTKALKFYTEILGFVKKTDQPAGDSRFVTVVSPEEPEGAELVLEATKFEPAKTFQEAVRKAGIPQTQFAVPDIQSAYERLTKLGVQFQQKPMPVGPTSIAMLDDTCGNVIQLIQIFEPQR